MLTSYIIIIKTHIAFSQHISDVHSNEIRIKPLL